jgi:hypothetical protein
VHLNESGSGSGRVPDAPQRTVAGLLGGGGVFIAIMLVLAGTAVALGWLRTGEAGPVDLRPWMLLEILGGLGASVLAGVVSRRIAHGSRGPTLLSIFLFVAGSLEAFEILHSVAAGRAAAPSWLVLPAPVEAAVGVLFGSWLAGRSSNKATRRTSAAADRGQVRG